MVRTAGWPTAQAVRRGRYGLARGDGRPQHPEHARGPWTRHDRDRPGHQRRGGNTPFGGEGLSARRRAHSSAAHLRDAAIDDRGWRGARRVRASGGRPSRPNRRRRDAHRPRVAPGGKPGGGGRGGGTHPVSETAIRAAGFAAWARNSHGGIRDGDLPAPQRRSGYTRCSVPASGYWCYSPADSPG